MYIFLPIFMRTSRVHRTLPISFRITEVSSHQVKLLNIVTFQSYRAVAKSVNPYCDKTSSSVPPLRVWTSPRVDLTLISPPATLRKAAMNRPLLPIIKSMARPRKMSNQWEASARSKFWSNTSSKGRLRPSSGRLICLQRTKHSTQSMPLLRSKSTMTRPGWRRQS